MAKARVEFKLVIEYDDEKYSSPRHWNWDEILDTGEGVEIISTEEKLLEAV